MLAHKMEERNKDVLTSFKRPKWPIRPNKRLHLKSCLGETNLSKIKPVIELLRQLCTGKEQEHEDVESSSKDKCRQWMARIQAD